MWASGFVGFCCAATMVVLVCFVDLLLGWVGGLICAIGAFVFCLVWVGWFMSFALMIFRDGVAVLVVLV